jgi:hypothetical protein
VDFKGKRLPSILLMSYSLGKKKNLEMILSGDIIGMAFHQKFVFHREVMTRLCTTEEKEVSLLAVVQIGKDPSRPYTDSYQGYSILPKDGVFCNVFESGEVTGEG